MFFLKTFFQLWCFCSLHDRIDWYTDLKKCIYLNFIQKRKHVGLISKFLKYLFLYTSDYDATN